MKKNISVGAIIIVAILIMVVSHSLFSTSVIDKKVTSDKALLLLEEGNQRYVEGDMEYPHINQKRREYTSKKGQHPFATVITCSDSRVPVEILFDRGIGDIFAIRVAGNVIDIDEAGSVEYGVDHLATPVFVVLGHTHCGTVTAVVQGDELHGNIKPLVDNIIPAAEKAKLNFPNLSGEELVTEAVKVNIWTAIDDLFKLSPVSRKRVLEGKLKVVGAIYDIETGKVDFLGIHPEQGLLLCKYEKEGAGVKHGGETETAHGEKKDH